MSHHHLDCSARSLESSPVNSGHLQTNEYYAGSNMPTGIDELRRIFTAIDSKYFDLWFLFETI